MQEFFENTLNVVFYRSASGNEPVRSWLRTLSKEDKKILGQDIKTIQLGWPLGMPLVRSLENGLWEIRSNLESKRIARMIFFMHQETIVLLHGFIKKTQKTARKNIDLALTRKKETERCDCL